MQNILFKAMYDLYNPYLTDTFSVLRISKSIELTGLKFDLLGTKH